MSNRRNRNRRNSRSYQDRMAWWHSRDYQIWRHAPKETRGLEIYAFWKWQARRNGLPEKPQKIGTPFLLFGLALLLAAIMVLG